MKFKTRLYKYYVYREITEERKKERTKKRKQRMKFKTRLYKYYVYREITKRKKERKKERKKIENEI